VNTPVTLRRVSPRVGYSLWAATYDECPNPLLALEERVVLPRLPQLAGKRALDLACGTGRWLAHLLARGAESGVGLDFSLEMLREARRKPGLHQQLISAECTAIPLRRDIADLAMCSFAVSYIEDVALAARELARVLLPGGALFVSDFHPSAYDRGWKRAFRYNETRIELTGFRYSVDEICNAFAAAGFELLARCEPAFGEEELFIFERAGKEIGLKGLFDQPAIFSCEFRKRALPKGMGKEHKRHKEATRSTRI
jgi:ubiquinone/menaquinone biosynthesis C-methylase UbiE